MVKAQNRSKGVGSALINTVKLWAKNRGLTSIELSVLSNNTDAEKLYKREGFKAKVLTMRVEL